MSLTVGFDVQDLQLDGGTQTRLRIDDAYIDALRDVIISGKEFRDPIVVFYDCEKYWLADGFHRVAATKRAGQHRLTADIRAGTKRDAILYSVGANDAHGLRRTNEDKRRAVETLLRDEEWNKWSDREIADRCGASNTFVGKVRAEITPSTVDSDAPTKRNYIDRHGNETAMRIPPPKPKPATFAVPVIPVNEDDEEIVDKLVKKRSKEPTRRPLTEREEDMPIDLKPESVVVENKQAVAGRTRRANSAIEKALEQLRQVPPLMNGKLPAHMPFVNILEFVECAIEALEEAGT